uniref:Protein kinase domain-containing protein n=1 Tax=Seriola lalandi dorsalis TaxID=1841481 RepID=A0A3B4XEP9_SERLL
TMSHCRCQTDKKPTGMTETTSPASPVSHDSENGYLQIEKYDVLSGKQSGYLIRKFLGMGAFGQVVQCIKLDTKEKMAVKIVRKDETWVGKREVTMLEKLRKLDQDKNNLIKFTEHFEHKGHVCIAFEMLDISVEDLIEKISSKPLYLSEIRVIAQQMLVALDALKSIGLAHGDIKPDNIMLVNHQLQPFKVKLIDFGLAIPISKMQAGTVIQTIGYRAPEVMLGLPLNEAVDMWGLGCVLAFMYLGQDPYPLHCRLEVMRVIMQMQGQPNDRIEYNTQDFLGLLKRMLHVDPEKRITPSEALGHRFISMKHLPSDANPNPHMSSHMDEANNTCPNSRAQATADRTAADNNNGPPGKADIDNNTAAETDKKPAANNTPTPSQCAIQLCTTLTTKIWPRLKPTYS